jgi:hypothetical protein
LGVLAVLKESATEFLTTVTLAQKKPSMMPRDGNLRDVCECADGLRVDEIVLDVDRGGWKGWLGSLWFDVGVSGGVVGREAVEG